MAMSPISTHLRYVRAAGAFEVLGLRQRRTVAVGGDRFNSLDLSAKPFENEADNWQCLSSHEDA